MALTGLGIFKLTPKKIVRTADFQPAWLFQ